MLANSPKEASILKLTLWVFLMVGCQLGQFNSKVIHIHPPTFNVGDPT